MNYPHTATVQRKTKSGTSYTFGSVGTVLCFLQPIDEESAQAFGITFTKGSRCYLPYDADVLTGDRLTVDGTTYGVAGIRKHNYGNLKHQRAVLEEV